MSIYGPQVASLVLAGNSQRFSGGVFRGPGSVVANPSDPSVAEESIWLLINDSFTASNLLVKTSSAQPNDGDLVVTLRKNGADTSLSVTIAAGTAAGSFSDTTNTASFAAGDYYSVSVVNESSSVSAPIVACVHTFV